MNEQKVRSYDKKQDRHRYFNTILISAVLCLLLSFGAYGYGKFSDLSDLQHKNSEIAQIVADEGFRKCVYQDSRKFPTIGFGHLVLPTEKFTCISHKEAVKLLRADYDYAEKSVDTRYPWAYGEVRLVLINMTYQMGQSGVSAFKKTLEYLHDEEYDAAAIELYDSRWADQTPNRARRLASRIMSLH